MHSSIMIVHISTVAMSVASLGFACRDWCKNHISNRLSYILEEELKSKFELN